MAVLHTPAWRLRGIGNEPGALSLVDGHIAFRTSDGSVFDVPLAEVSDVNVPWYYFSGGLKLVVNGEAYRFSFVQPDGALDVPLRLLPGGGTGEAGILKGREAGKAWRRALGV